MEFFNPINIVLNIIILDFLETWTHFLNGFANNQVPDYFLRLSRGGKPSDRFQDSCHPNQLHVRVLACVLALSVSRPSSAVIGPLFFTSVFTLSGSRSCFIFLSSSGNIQPAVAFCASEGEARRRKTDRRGRRARCRCLYPRRRSGATDFCPGTAPTPLADPARPPSVLTSGESEWVGLHLQQAIWICSTVERSLRFWG